MRHVIHVGLIIVTLLTSSIGVTAQQGSFDLPRHSNPQKIWSTSSIFGVEATVTLFNSPLSEGNITVTALNISIAPGNEGSYEASAMRSVEILLEDPNLSAKGTWDITIYEGPDIGFQDLGAFAAIIVVVAVVIIAVLRSRD